jgi:hypothetical protein
MGTPLAADAPVGPALHHADDALSAPARKPLDLLYLLQRRAAEVARLHRDEPLLRRAEEERALAAPTVRVGVLDLLVVEERAQLAQPLDDARVGVEDQRALVIRDLVGEAAAVVDG